MEYEPMPCDLCGELVAESDQAEMVLDDEGDDPDSRYERVVFCHVECGLARHATPA